MSIISIMDYLVPTSQNTMILSNMNYSQKDGASLKPKRRAVVDCLKLNELTVDDKYWLLNILDLLD